MDDKGPSAVVFVGSFLLSYVLWQKLRGASSRNSTLSLPGPPLLPTLPVIGSVLSLPKFGEMHVRFLEMSKSIGAIFAFYLGSRHTIIIQSREALHEALVKRSADFSNRSSSFVKLVCNPGENGIIDRKYDSTFKKSHHQCFTILRKFGFGQGIMEVRINREVEQLVCWVKEQNGTSFSPDTLIAKCVMNVIASILFGQRFDLSDERRDRFIADIYNFVRRLMKVVPVNSIPALRFLPGIRDSYNDLCQTHDRMMDFLGEKLNESLADETNVSFVSCYCEAEGASYDRTELLYILRDLIVAGTETSLTTIRWALVTLANHPDVQERLHQEIDTVVPSSRLPSLDDRINLPYVEATILELMRRRTVAPLSIPRETARDTELSGYDIPAGTMVFASLYAVHMDPDVWTEPSVFKPERFLDDSGKVFGKDRVIPFGLGRRSCLGELLARQEMFLFIAGLVQQFDVRPPGGLDYVDVVDELSITLAPSRFDVRLIARQPKLS